MYCPNVENKEHKCKKTAALPTQTIYEVLKDISVMAGDALTTVRNINSFMMAESADDSEKTDEPSCFREDLIQTRDYLFRLNNELSDLASVLGIG